MMKKKEPSQRTKVVIRHLPPFLSQFLLFSQIDHLFSQRYSWFRFSPAKFSQKHQRYSRAYIDFKSPDDAVEFSDFFNGHTFFNEKGSQFKAIVEYAPYQRVPRPCSFKDAREETIFYDSDYLEFLKLIAKPAENPRGAEIQLEIKEGELPAAVKESPITTPLMEYVRQKRAAEDGNQGASAAVKYNKRTGDSMDKHRSSATKHGAQRKKGSTKNSNQKSKSISLAVPNGGDQPDTVNGKEISRIDSASSVKRHVSTTAFTGDSGNKMLRKGKEREISVSRDTLQEPGNSAVSTSHKQNKKFKHNERLIKGNPSSNEARKSQSLASINPSFRFQKSNLENNKQLSRLVNKLLGSNDQMPSRNPSSNEARKSQSLASLNPSFRFQQSNLENNKQLSQPVNKLVGSNDCLPSSETLASTSNCDINLISDDKFLTRDTHNSAFSNGKQEKNTRNDDRPDHGGQTSLDHSNDPTVDLDILLLYIKRSKSGFRNLLVRSISWWSLYYYICCYQYLGHIVAIDILFSSGNSLFTKMYRRLPDLELRYSSSCCASGMALNGAVKVSKTHSGVESMQKNLLELPYQEIVDIY